MVAKFNSNHINYCSRFTIHPLNGWVRFNIVTIVAAILFSAAMLSNGVLRYVSDLYAATPAKNTEIEASTDDSTYSD